MGDDSSESIPQTSEISGSLSSDKELLAKKFVNLLFKRKQEWNQYAREESQKKEIDIKSQQLKTQISLQNEVAESHRTQRRHIQDNIDQLKEKIKNVHLLISFLDKRYEELEFCIETLHLVRDSTLERAFDMFVGSTATNKSMMRLEQFEADDEDVCIFEVQGPKIDPHKMELFSMLCEK